MNADHIAIGLASYVVLLFSLSFHESAHAWMAQRMGDDTAAQLGRISLNPIMHIDPVGTLLIPLLQFASGGMPLLAWAKPTPVQSRNFHPGMLARGHVLVAGAGPASNALLSLAFAVLLLALVRTEAAARGDFSVLLLSLGIHLNVALAFFNLLPIPPLDGSWVASWGLPRGLGARYDRVVEPLGQYLLLLLFIPLARYVVMPLTSLVTGVVQRAIWS